MRRSLILLTLVIVAFALVPVACCTNDSREDLPPTSTADTTPPALTIDYSPTYPTDADQITLRIKTNADDLDRIFIVIDGIQVDECSESPCTYTGGPYPLGYVTCRAAAYDESGNVASKSQSILVSGDATPPNLSITHYPQDPTNDVQVTFKATASDSSGISKIDIYVDEVKVKECAHSSCTFTGGPYFGETVSYHAKAWDRVWNQATAGPKSFVVAVPDTTPPEVSITHSPESPTDADPVTFTATASDESGIQKIEIYVNGAKIEEYASSPCSYTGGPYSAGMVGYHAIAWDQAGNQATAGPNSLTITRTSTPTPTPEPTQVEILEIFKYNDLNHSGDYNPAVDEPLEGWEFTVSGLPGSYFTDADGWIRIEVDPGIYTVTEVTPLPIGWTNTDPGDGTYQDWVNVPAGGSGRIRFGNAQ
jgi:hypothetical protein